MATLSNETASAAPPPVPLPEAAPAPARPAAPRSPCIYYLHPLLAGALADWGQHFARIARLGFDHVLIAPPFLPGRSGSILLAADYDRLHPRLGWEGDALGGLRRIAEDARAAALTPMLDLLPNRVAADSALADGRLFRAPQAIDALDPCRYPPEADSAEARTDSDAAIQALADWWAGQVAGWAEAGFCGFRFMRLAAVPPLLLRRVTSAVRASGAKTLFLGWTADMTSSQWSGLAGAGLDYVFSALPSWDFRAEWFWQQSAALQRVAPVLACPEAPWATRLAATCRNPGVLEPMMRRALGFAAAIESGWLMPMGFEYATVRAMDPKRDTADDFARMAAEAPIALTEPIEAANALRAREPVLAASGEARLLSGPGGPIVSVLRPELRRELRADAPDLPGVPSGRRAAFIVLNADLAHRHDVPAAMLSDASGSFVPDRPDGGLTLAPGELVVLTAEPAPAVKLPPEDLEASALAAAGAPRLAIEAVSPVVDDGLFAAKRAVGDLVTVEADLIGDGHDVLAAVVQWRPADEAEWREVRMHPLGNDRWQATFSLRRLGLHEFAIEVWRDAFASFREELSKKHAAGVETRLEVEEGRHLVEVTAAAAPEALRAQVTAFCEQLAVADQPERRRLLLSAELAALMEQAEPRRFKLRSEKVYRLVADRAAARFASWYELFPRSMSDDPERHGTFRDVIRHLPRIRDMGFDVLYFPPIHPIGRANRKGRNNTLRPAPGDPGSPYAIGSDEGGHDAIHPELGTFEDFQALREAALGHGMEIALDFAIQCSPDHPWLKEHREWFSWRPDGSLRYAENPPKKYEDIVNVDFYAEGAIPGLWQALCDVVLFWAEQGVRIFRVDNPHTKPLPFWHWLIAQVTARYPDAIFLAEAFTRPKVMYRLAKLGFTQSYTYFTWRNTKRELRDYLEELTSTARDFFRPNFFVNTPDINPAYLQTSGRPGFLIRAALAATLSGLWGVYTGFELGEARPLPGREEYADSEKYQIRAWDWQRPGNIVAEITALNWLRRSNPALQTHLGVAFLNAFNDAILYYEKATPDRANVVLVAVNLDPHNVQEADFEIPLWKWGLADGAALEAEDLLTHTRAVWHGKIQHVRLDPNVLPYAIWRVRPTV